MGLPKLPLKERLPLSEVVKRWREKFEDNNITTSTLEAYEAEGLLTIEKREDRLKNLTPEDRLFYTYDDQDGEYIKRDHWIDTGGKVVYATASPPKTLKWVKREELLRFEREEFGEGDASKELSDAYKVIADMLRVFKEKNMNQDTVSTEIDELDGAFFSKRKANDVFSAANKATKEK